MDETSQPPTWAFTSHAPADYRHKITDTCRIISDWFEPYGGIADRDVLEFGCGEGTMATGIALQYRPRRMVGVEILDIVMQCEKAARANLGLERLPGNMELHQIAAGADLRQFGVFDAIYTWSVFEHVHTALLGRAFQTLASALKPDGALFLQISPLFYSAAGSHLLPWVAKPWGHLLSSHQDFEQMLQAAPETPLPLRETWSVYIPMSAPKSEERRLLWETYATLNKASAPQLERHANDAGLKIVRDYRTYSEQPVPPELLDVYREDALKTEQIVWVLQHA